VPGLLVSPVFVLKTELLRELVQYRVLGIEARAPLARFDGLRAGWDGRDMSGRPVASGTYFYRLAGMRDSQARKMVLLK